MPSLQMVFDVIAHDAASAQFRLLGREIESAGQKAEMTKGKIAEHFKAIGAASALALVAIGAESVKMAANFQASMLLLQTQAGASTTEVKNMTKAVLDLAPAVGFGPEALALSLYHIESVGLRGAQALDVLKLAAQGAKVGHADLEQTTNALTAAVASGMQGTQDYAAAMGKLNAIVGAGDMKMSDLNDAMSTGILVTMKQYGVTLNDVGAALATFGDNNVRGQLAATQLRMAVQALSKPAAGGAVALASIGLSAQNLRDDLQKGGLNLALTDLHEHLVKSGKDGTEAGQLLTEAFGKRAGSGLQILNGQIDRFHGKIDIMANTDAKSFGDAWSATNETLKQKFADLTASVQSLAIKLGNDLLPIATTIFTYLADHQGVVEALAFGIGTLLVAATVAWTVALLANPVGAVIAGIMLLVGTVVYCWEHFQRFRDIIVGVWKAVGDSTFNTITFALHVFKMFGDGIFDVTLSAGELLLGFARLSDKIFGTHLADGVAKGLGNIRSFKTGFDQSIDGAINKVNSFQGAFNSALDGLRDKTVHLAIISGYNAPQDLGLTHQYATGGAVFGAGSGTSDSIPALLSNGEHVWTAREVANAGGHGAVEAMRSSFAHYATGGAVGHEGPRLNLDLKLDGERFISQAMDYFNGTTSSIVTEAVASSIATEAVASNAASSASAGGAAQWSNVVSTALQMLGQPLSLLNGVLSLINSESGGNPNAVNNWDSNARAGHPSKGLMQEIPSTFEAYRSPWLPDDIFNPLANVYAGINYALHNYGPGMLAAGGRHGAGGGYVGYDTGGLLPSGGVGMNRSGSPERILSPAQTAAFERLADDLGSDGGMAQLAAEIRGLRADVRSLPREHQMLSRSS